MVDWLEACSIDPAAMEVTTGVYWIPIYEILEKRGFEVGLMNAHDPPRYTDRHIMYRSIDWQGDSLVP